MKTLIEFNKEIFDSINEKYYDDLKTIVLKIQKQDVEEAKDIYELTLSILKQLHVWDFDLRYFYKETIAKRDSKISTINQMVSKYQQKDYKEINELYNDWRIIIHEIWNYIWESLSEYALEYQKADIHNKELEDIQKEFWDIKNLEKMLDEI